MKKVIILLVAVCIIATMAFVGVGCKTAVDETQSTWQLSEQPDKARYDEYFTEFYLGKLPLGQQMPLVSCQDNNIG
jgi:hypothetical protein